MTVKHNWRFVLSDERKLIPLGNRSNTLSDGPLMRMDLKQLEFIARLGHQGTKYTMGISLGSLKTTRHSTIVAKHEEVNEDASANKRLCQP